MYILYLYIYKSWDVCGCGPHLAQFVSWKRREKTKTTNKQPAGHILEALTFAFPAVGITTSMVAVCCMTFPQAGRAFSQGCSNMHPASYCIMDFSPTDVRSTLAAKPAKKIDGGQRVADGEFQRISSRKKHIEMAEFPIKIVRSRRQSYKHHWLILLALQPVFRVLM